VGGGREAGEGNIHLPTSVWLAVLFLYEVEFKFKTVVKIANIDLEPTFD
jgi:hypothetical protein